MPQLRRDPVGGRWVIVATERAARPRDFRLPRREAEGGFCPFCAGNEEKTPPEVFAFREEGSEPNGPGWDVRVVPNKYPALRVDGRLETGDAGVYETLSGIGEHEVFIESPRHVLSLGELEPREVRRVVWAYRRRMEELRKDKRLVYALIFKNVGKTAGASLEHSHSQLICTPVVPKRVGEEMDRCEEFYRFQGRCLLCEIIQQELEARERVVVESRRYMVITPYASRFPFEMWIVPKAHYSHFEDTDRESTDELGSVLHETLNRLDATLEKPPYNYVLHTAPFTVGRLKHFHWHIEIIPRVTHVAGFEWGTGFYINPVMPADAARSLRKAQVPALAPRPSARPEAAREPG